MKRTKLFFLLCPIVIFFACDNEQKPTSQMPGPSGFKAEQAGDLIKLSWNAVPEADFYEIRHNQDYWHSTNKTYVEWMDTEIGFNFFELVTVFLDGSRSQAATASVDFVQKNPDETGNKEPQVSIIVDNLTGYWHGTTITYDDGEVESMSKLYEYYINLGVNGIFERITVTAPSACDVEYGTWRLTRDGNIYIELQACYCFKNGQNDGSWDEYDGTTHSSDYWGITSLTARTMEYTWGTYPFLQTHAWERIYSIPVIYKHLDEIIDGGNTGNTLAVNKTNLTGNWKYQGAYGNIFIVL